MFVPRDTFLTKHKNCRVPICFSVASCPLSSLSFNLLLLFYFVFVFIIKGSQKKAGKGGGRRLWKKITLSLPATTTITNPGDGCRRD